MNIDGFTLLLQDFCAYCPDFEPEVEKIDCTTWGDDGKRYQNNICCYNQQRCARIALNLGERLKENG